MGIPTEFKGVHRIIGICHRLQATEYINAPGGRALYNFDHFKSQHIRLGFIAPTPAAYPQGSTAFVANLSMIDVLMWNPPERIIQMLEQYGIDYGPT